MDQGDSQQLVPTDRSSSGDILAPQEQVRDRDADEIRREIEASRRQISHSIGQLRAEVSTTVERALDWRQWVHDHPQTAVGAAFGLGLYFGLR